MAPINAGDSRCFGGSSFIRSKKAPSRLALEKLPPNLGKVRNILYVFALPICLHPGAAFISPMPNPARNKFVMTPGPRTLAVDKRHIAA
jgi:hypothetical protein